MPFRGPSGQTAGTTAPAQDQASSFYQPPAPAYNPPQTYYQQPSYNYYQPSYSYTPSYNYNYRPASTYRAAPAPPPPPPDPLNNIPTGYKNELETLRDQWEQLDGYGSNVSDANLAAMAGSGVTTLEQMGQYMANHALLTNTSVFPWAQYGMTANQYVTLQTELQIQWQALTGADATAAQQQTWFTQAYTNGLSASDMVTKWQNDATMQSTYGWLKYGLNYSQFTTQKQQMIQAFGNANLSNDEAVKQLMFWHTNQGANQSAAVEPTFTQVEKKQASTGVTGQGVVVR